MLVKNNFSDGTTRYARAHPSPVGLKPAHTGGDGGGRSILTKKARKKNTWGSIFRNSLARGDDHGYAAYLADAWERRQKA